MQNSETKQLNQHIGKLFSESLRISSPVQMLHIMREKIIERDYQHTDKHDILCELGQLQQIMGKLNDEMLRIYDLLNKPQH